jgi:PII-like signaling protein
VSEAAIKLTSYFSERDRVRGALLADALFDVYERHEVRASVLLRGSAGFGDRPGAHSERSLTLSESLPAVSVAVDAEVRIERALPEVLELAEHGLVSLERARLMSDSKLGTRGLPFDSELASELHGESELGAPEPRSDPRTMVKLTLYGCRGIRADGEAGYVRAIEALRGARVSGASVLLAVDGTLRGERRRGRFFARNAGVPLMVIAVGDPASLARAWTAVSRLLDRPVATLERVQVCRSDGQLSAPPLAVPEHDEAGLPIWQKLMVHAEEQAKSGGAPLHSALIRELRLQGAAGATVLRGVRGFYGDRGPFADRIFAVRRHAPMLTVIVDTPSNIQRLWPVVEEVTREAGLVTSELVPAFHREPVAGIGRSSRARLARIWGDPGPGPSPA